LNGPNSNCASHLVVSPNGTIPYDGNYSVTNSNGTFTFPDVGSLVEASLGNLETQNDFLDYAALGVTAQPGFQNTYFWAAQSGLQPLNAIINATLGFFAQMASAADVHFGLTTFNNGSGTISTQSFSASNISPIYPPGGTNIFPLPGIPLDPNNNNYTSGTLIPSYINALSVYAGRNTAAALQTAITQIQNGARPTANAAIVLLTDGIPTVPLANAASGALDPTTAASDARAQAVTAHSLGIPIYCVVLSQAADGSDQAPETAIYNDTNSNPTLGGLSAISGFGAKYYQVVYTDPATTQASLQKVLGNIARQLVSLMK
jgi:hypothetical protein